MKWKLKRKKRNILIYYKKWDKVTSICNISFYSPSASDFNEIVPNLTKTVKPSRSLLFSIPEASWGDGTTPPVSTSAYSMKLKLASDISIDKRRPLMVSSF